MAIKIAHAYSIVEMQSDSMRENLLLGNHDSSDNSGDDSQQEDEKTEADPSLFASGSS